MLRIYRFSLVITCLVGFVASCTSPNNDYITAKSVDPITVPESLETKRLGELYPVPEGTSDQLQTTTPLPPTVGVQSTAVASAFVLGDRLWLLNNKSLATTWSQLLEFWQAQAIPVDQQEVTTATMTTGWFAEAVQPGFEVRYQFLLKRGLQYDSTEIHLINQVRKLDTIASPWQTVADNPNHSQWLAARLEAFLNTRLDAINDSFLASQLNLPARVSYSEEDNQAALMLDVDSERLASALARALEQPPLHFYAADTSRNIYHINVIDPETNKGLITRLNPFSAQKPLVSPYPLAEILSGLSASGEVSKKLSAVPGYLLNVRDITQSQKQMTLSDGYGAPLPLDEARFVIDTLRRQLR